MRVAVIYDTEGKRLGTIIEQDDGKVTGEGKGESLIEQAPGKTFDDWIRTVHHSTYLRLVEETSR
jgi:hypothetical protein